MLVGVLVEVVHASCLHGGSMGAGVVQAKSRLLGLGFPRWFRMLGCAALGHRLSLCVLLAMDPNRG